MTARRERASGAINALLLLLFLGGAALLLLREDTPAAERLTSGHAALCCMGLVLCLDLLLCMSPLALLFQPVCMPLLGAACCREAVVILQAAAFSDVGLRLLLLLLLVPACFLLGGRGIWNALLLTRAIRADRDGLGSSVRLCCVLAIFAFAALCLLGRILRFA